MCAVNPLPLRIIVSNVVELFFCVQFSNTPAPTWLLMAVLQMLSTPLFCLLAATAEAAEARQVIAALRAAPPQLIVRSSNRQNQAAVSPATAVPAAPAWQSAPTEPSSAQGFVTSRDQHSRTNPAGADSNAVEEAVATSVAAFAPQLSVPLTLGLQYTNSGVLTAVCLFWAAVLWPR